MAILIVVDNPKDWKLKIRGVHVTSARDYLTDPGYTELKLAKVFNLCKSYRYQSLGYYVSLLASARGHKPLPNTTTVQDLKMTTMIRIASHELEEIMQESLGQLKARQFELSIYFGRNLAKRYERLALALFNMFPAPLLRAEFRLERGRWELKGLRPIDADEIPGSHRSFVVEAAETYFSRPHRRGRRTAPRYDMAILFNEDDPTPPSDQRALKKFVRAAEAMGIDAEIIGKDDFGRVAEFDALFVRETTRVNHHTFRFARKGLAEGLVVIDDPDSIIKCANKVYLAELLRHQHIPAPETVIIHRGNFQLAPLALGFPIVLKQPDSSFSKGVVKVSDQAEYERQLAVLFKESDLLIAQGFVPTKFDWRVGIIDRQPLFVCRYFMAGQHWQIYDHTKTGVQQTGEADCWPVDSAPSEIVKTALKAANLIGDGLYGVDLKDVGGKPIVIEVNDNPSIDAGVEDAVLGDELYLRIMRSFLRRLDARGK